MYRDFGTILLAMAVGIVFLCLPLFLQWLLAPSNKTKDKLEVFECGEDPEGSAWFFKLKIKDNSELDSLMNREEYEKFSKESSS
mgnify:CR=1 FL=1